MHQDPVVGTTAATRRLRAQLRSRGVAAASDSSRSAGAAGWVDGWHPHQVVGWLVWPEGLQEPWAEVNGVVHPLRRDLGARPDVQAVLGTPGPVDSFLIAVDLEELEWNGKFEVVVTNGSVRLLLQSGDVGTLILAQATAELAERPQEVQLVERAKAVGWRPPATPAGLALGAARRNGSVSPTPEAFFRGRCAPGVRSDLTMSPFMAHFYLRHARDHPAHRTTPDRNHVLARRKDMRDYLVWACREYVRQHVYAPLPLAAAELEELNALVSETGLAKGRPGVLRDLPLTLAQRDFVLERCGKVATDSPEEYADWLLAWVGSWGWGHRGSVLLSEGQQRFFTAGTQLAAGRLLVRDVLECTWFVGARRREQPRFVPENPQLLGSRLAALLVLAASEIVDVGTDAMLGEALLTALTQWTTGPTQPFRATPAVAPQVRVLGMIGSRSGLGQNTRHSIAAFERSGLVTDSLTVALNDSTVVAGVGDAGSSKAPINVWHLNPDNLPEALTTVDPAVFIGSYNVGFFAWELDLQPRVHDLALEWIDEVWVPSTYCAASFQGATKKPVVVMPHCLMLPQASTISRQSLGIDPSSFVVHFAFDLHSWPLRKNPLGAIEAFQAAFPADQDVVLFLKIRNGHNIGRVDSDLDGAGDAVLELAQEDPRIVIDSLERSYADTLGLLQMSDCHISLHRSEGFGYSLAESLMLGIPLIASDYGGSRDYCTRDNAWLVPTTERFLREGEYYLAPPGSRWGEPDLDAAAAALRSVRDRGPDVAARVANGLRDARSAFSLDTMADRYGRRAREILDSMPTASD